MASKETNRKRAAGGARKSGPTAPRAPRKTGKRKAPPPLFEVSLRPEHQRELFALTLITIALVTLIFFVTGSAGGVGEVYVLGVQQAFGSGALAVPLVLGMLGVGILIQERLSDARLSGSNVIGTFMVLGMLLSLLEFPVHALALAGRGPQGGGLVGYTVVNLLDVAIGRPAALLVVSVLALVGVMLTFNLTLRELIVGTTTWFHQLWQVAWGGPRRSTRPTRADPAEPGPPLPMPGATLPDADDIVPTPIAARLTRASLFQRPEGMPPPVVEEAKPKARERKKAVNAAAEPVAKTPPTTAAPAAATKPLLAPTPVNEAVQEALDGFDVPTIHRAWPLPNLEMLDLPVEGGITDEERRVRARLIEETLASFKVEARVVGVNTGPAVTQFELQPAVGVKVSKITTLERDLALALAAQSIRIEAPIPGKAVVGIEIPNSAISTVSLREVVDSEEFDSSKAKLKLPLGKDVSGTPVIADMARMPHLLVAGSTGSGKSVAINVFLCALLLKNSPDDLKLIMVDPKMVELIVYNRVPHLLAPVVTELERVVPTLKWATREMERRYKIFARHGCRNLDSYRQLARRRADLEPMPYILIVIDELADLMMMAPDEVETYICRLAQMARATGIHLILATQRPSVDVITGLIKANFPSRIAFAVSSQVDSRVILDVPGADQLLGRGDMLYMAADAAKLVRIQGTFVSDREVEQIVTFWRNAVPPEMPTTSAKPTAGGSVPTAATGKPASPPPPATAPAPLPGGPPLTLDEQDELLPKARSLVQQHERASASLLVRRMRIGYSKAAQLIDLLEQQGVVGPADGGRSREVLQSTAADEDEE